jgi:hypothetical protein
LGDKRIDETEATFGDFRNGVIAYLDDYQHGTKWTKFIEFAREMDKQGKAESFRAFVLQMKTMMDAIIAV